MIITPQSSLDGAHPCTVLVRPARYAFLIRDDDPQMAAEIIQANCLTWGGMFNLLVPLNRTTGLSDDWRLIIQAFDPDLFIACTWVDAVTEKQLSARGQYVLEWYSAAAREPAISTGSMVAMLSAEQRRHDGTPVVALPHLDPADSMYLPLLARFGTVTDEVWKLDSRNRQYEAPTFAEMVRTERRSWSERVLAISGDDPDVPLAVSGSSNKYGMPIRSTSLHLNFYYAQRPFAGVPEDQPRHDAWYQSKILVTGQTGSVPDLCLFWALRALHPMSEPFPLWIPMEVLRTDEGQEGLIRALRRHRDDQPVPFSGPAVLSSSATGDDIVTVLGDGVRDARIYTGDFHQFMSPHAIAGIQTVTELYFERGRTRLAVPRHEVLDKLDWRDQVSVEVDIPGYRLPNVPRMGSRIYGSLHRVGKAGLVSTYRPSVRRELSELVLPNRWRCLETILEAGGYGCAPSDKGRLALAVFNLFGGMRGINLLASSRVWSLMDRMAKRHVTRRKFVEAVRPDLSFSEIKNTIKHRDATATIEWLLRQGIIVRGARIICDVCNLNKWYALDRMAARQFVCDGCFTTRTIPLKVDATQWRYRLNELVGNGFDQGVHTHLFTMRTFRTPWSLGDDAQSLGFYPGVNLRRADSSIGGPDACELDLVEIRNGRLMIGECKVAGQRLDQSELDKYALLSERFDCDRIVLAAMTPLDNDVRTLIDDMQAKTHAKVLTIDLSRSFDRWSLERLVGDDAHEVPRDADKYLSGVIADLTNEGLP